MPRPWWETRLTVLCVAAALATLVWLPASLALLGVWMGTLNWHLIASAWGLTAFTAALGLLALMIGVRGRVYPRGEHCARCGYDVAATLNLDAPLCPECGSDLSRKGAVATKRWLPRWRLTAAGLAALLIGGAPPAVVRSWPSVGYALAGALHLQSHWSMAIGHPIGRPRHPLLHITILSGFG